jgi:hypothetical protein
MKTITDPTNRRTRSLLASAALAVVLLPGLLAGCSTTSDDGTAGPSTGTARQGSSMAECMRGKGYDVPDPSSGGRTMDLSAPDGVDPEQYQTDLTTCLGDAEGAGNAQVAKPMEGLDDKMQQAAECIRDNGFSDYPDDEDGKRAYQPDDADAFAEVAKTCDEQAFGADTTGVGE